MLNFSVERDPSSQVERNGWPMANDDSKLSLRFLSPALSSSCPSGRTRYAFDSLSVSFLEAPLSLVFLLLVKFVTHRQISRKGVKKKKNNEGCIFQVRDFLVASSLVSTTEQLRLLSKKNALIYFFRVNFFLQIYCF